jgi:hypothetical protein
MKQTAVEWLVEKIQQANPTFKFDALIREAKEMEKEQIEKAFDNGWQRANDTKDKSYTTAEDYGFNYYNKTFKSE